MTCDPIKGCPPDTHNLHCGYPACAKGEAERSKQAEVATSEIEPALKLAEKVLNRPNADPDDDLAVLARNLIRQVDLDRVAVAKIIREHGGHVEHSLAAADAVIDALRHRRCHSAGSAAL